MKSLRRLDVLTWPLRGRFGRRVRDLSSALGRDWQGAWLRRVAGWTFASLTALAPLTAGAEPPSPTTQEAPPPDPKGRQETAPPAGTDGENEPIVPPEFALPKEPEGQSAAKAALESAARGKTDSDVLAAVAGVPAQSTFAAIDAALGHTDERVRRAAVVVAKSLGRKAPLVSLVRGLGDPAPAVAAAAADALGDLGAKDSAVSVAAALSHASVTVRCAAAQAVAKLLPEKQAVLALTPRLTSNNAREIGCLVTALDRFDDARAFTRAVALLDDIDTHGVLAAPLGSASAKIVQGALASSLAGGTDSRLAGALGALASRPDAVKLWNAALPRLGAEHQVGVVTWLAAHASLPGARAALEGQAKSGAPALRAAIIDALSTADARGTAPMARGWLSDPSPVVRAAAARVFARAPDRRETTLLVNAFQNERAKPTADNLPVRKALLEALGGAGSADQAAMFADALGVEGESDSAIEALVRLGAPAVPTLALIVKLGDAQRTPLALEALSRIGAGVADTASRLLEDPREGVRKLGRDLLAASQDPASVAALSRLVDSDKVEDPVPVVQAIATFTSDAAVEALLRATTHPSATVRAAAAEGLGATQVDAATSLATLVRLAEADTDPNVRVSAIQALFRLGYPDLAKLLSKIISYDAPDVRMVAYDALGWFGDPTAIVAVGDRLGDAAGPEKEVLSQAIARLSRRKDLTSSRTVREWHATLAGARGPEGDRTVVKVGDVSLTLRGYGSGPTTLVLPGALPAASFAAALAGADSGRYLVVEGRGRGATPIGKAGLTIEQEVKDLEAIRVALKAERIRIVSFEASAYVAAAYAKAHPDRVNGLCLISAPTRGGLDVGVAAAARRLDTPTATDLASLDARFAWYAPGAYWLYRYSTVLPGLVAAPASAARVRQFAPSPHVADALARATEGKSLGKLLGKLDTPVLLVYGEKSPVGSDALGALKRLGDGGRVKVTMLAGVGEFPQIESPSALAAPLREFQAMR